MPGKMPPNHSSSECGRPGPAVETGLAGCTAWRLPAPRWSRARARVGRGARLAVLALAAGVAVGCATETALRFQCDPVVNDGILLTIDLVQVNEAEAAQIRQEGVRWFYSTLRQTLSMRRKTVAVERGKCPPRVVLQPEKGYEILAVVADYRSAPSDRVDGFMQFRTRKEWKGRTLDIAVRGVYLTVEPGR